MICLTAACFIIFLSSDHQQFRPITFFSVNLPFLRQVPSKMLWVGVAHRTHSKGRKIRIFAHESPCTESSHHHLHAWASAASGCESHQTFDTTEQACPWLHAALTPRAELPASSGCSTLLSVRPVIVKSQLSSSTCLARYTEEILLSSTWISTHLYLCYF